jgi:hypothetical protein
LADEIIVVIKILIEADRRGSAESEPVSTIRLTISELRVTHSHPQVEVEIDVHRRERLIIDNGWRRTRPLPPTGSNESSRRVLNPSHN